MSEEYNDDFEEDSRPSVNADYLVPGAKEFTYEEIRSLLFSTHKVSLSDDDPILMLVTLLNVHLGQLERTHRRHEQASKIILAEQSAKYIDDVKNTTSSLGEILKNSSIEAVRDIFSRQAAVLQSHMSSSKWCAAVIASSAIINLIIFILMGLKN
jgi:hypothetical protein